MLGSDFKSSFTDAPFSLQIPIKWYSRGEC